MKAYIKILWIILMTTALTCLSCATAAVQAPEYKTCRLRILSDLTYPLNIYSIDVPNAKVEFVLHVEPMGQVIITVQVGREYTFLAKEAGELVCDTTVIQFSISPKEAELSHEYNIPITIHIKSPTALEA